MIVLLICVFIISVAAAGVVYERCTVVYRDIYPKIFSWGYNIALLPFLVIMIGCILRPEWRGYEPLGRFFMYVPIIAANLWVVTCLPLTIAYIACKKKMRGQVARELTKTEKLWQIIMWCYLVLIMSFFFPYLTRFIAVPMLILMAGISLYRIGYLLVWAINRPAN